MPTWLRRHRSVGTRTRAPCAACTPVRPRTTCSSTATSLRCSTRASVLRTLRRFAELLADRGRAEELAALCDEVDAAPADRYDSHPSLGQRLAVLAPCRQGLSRRTTAEPSSSADPGAAGRRATQDLLGHLGQMSVVERFDDAAPLYARGQVEAGKALLAAVPKVDGGSAPGARSGARPRPRRAWQRARGRLHPGPPYGPGPGAGRGGRARGAAGCRGGGPAGRQRQGAVRGQLERAAAGGERAGDAARAPPRGARRSAQPCHAGGPAPEPHAPWRRPRRGGPSRRSRG